MHFEAASGVPGALVTPAQLIPISINVIGAEKVNAVDARGLWLFLGVGKDFSTWIKVQIERARLLEHRDFEVLPLLGENPSGGRPRTEYLLALDAAKHIGIMSGTDKGFEVRDYFVAGERRALGMGFPWKCRETFQWFPP